MRKLRLKMKASEIKGYLQTLREAGIGVLAVTPIEGKADTFIFTMADKDFAKLTDFTSRVEVAQTTEAAQKAMSRNNHFTSEYELAWSAEIHSQGYYLIGEGTRTKVTQFITYNNELIRKPRGSKAIGKLEKITM